MEEWGIVLNDNYGYFEVQPKPSNEFLKDYYSKKYFQDNKSLYSHSYTEVELEYFTNKIKERYWIFEQYFSDKRYKSLKALDVGCGEGFTSKFLMDNGMEVTALDYSNYGIQQMHPSLLAVFMEGDIIDNITLLQDKGEKFDLVWLDNVLEHSLDPIEMIEKCKSIISDNGMLIIEVPNDFSKFQNKLIEKNIVKEEYWVAYPDHLTYFGRESLNKLLESNGWNLHKLIADFPIQWGLVNKNSNYSIKKENGQQAHETRLFMDNFIHETNNVAEIVAFYESLANIGLGRQLTGCYTLA